MKRLSLITMLFLASFSTAYAEAPTATAIKDEAVTRIRALPPPLQSASGKVFVSCLSADRATYRWPVMRFTETVAKHLSDTYLPLGSAVSPLSIELGTQTNAVSTIERRIFRTGDGFSQLVIRIPNPETVELETLREAIAEALLRERAREAAGRYAAFTWPKWFLSAIVNASKGNLWKAEAYERFIDAIADKPAPTLDQVLLTRGETITPEMDAFFAIWLLEETGLTKEARVQLLSTPWAPQDLRKTLDESKWQTWLDNQKSRVFLPGALTRSQYHRWKETLIEPEDVNTAVNIVNEFPRAMIARPQLFGDLCDLYLKAYTAYISDGKSAYLPLREQADEAAKALDQYFLQHELLTHEPFAPAAATLQDLSRPEEAPQTL